MKNLVNRLVNRHKSSAIVRNWTVFRHMPNPLTIALVSRNKLPRKIVRSMFTTQPHFLFILRKILFLFETVRCQLLTKIDVKNGSSGREMASGASVE